MQDPLISVVIPVFNGEPYLAQALESVFAQGYRQLEVIVVDDGSTDRSQAVVARFPEVRLVAQANSGPAVSRNRALAESRGELIAFIDQDDIWAPQKLQLQVGYLQRHAQVGAVLARQRMFIEPGVAVPEILKRNMEQQRSEKQSRVAYALGALLIRRSAVVAIGEFNPKFGSACAEDWFFRLRDAGVVTRVLPKTLLLKRYHANNLGYRVDEMKRELLTIARESIQRKQRVGS